jgi:hypothetical protein
MGQDTSDISDFAHASALPGYFGLTIGQTYSILREENESPTLVALEVSEQC